MKKTALNDRHRSLGAKMTDFHGWEMPLYYSSILDEHKAVRQSLGIFDIAHMGQVLVTGKDAAATLNQLFVSDISQVGPRRACYTLMLNESGGIIDDVIVYRLGEEDYLVVINCANRETDFAWMRSHQKGNCAITDISEGRSILAVQGPKASRVLEEILDARVAGLGRFEIAPIRTMSPDACIARTGYTGGDGFELFLPDNHAKRVWDSVLAGGASIGALPIGLGARDTLRIEAGLRLYGTDMDAKTSPIEVGLEWTIAINKADFIGKQPLVAQKQSGVKRKFAGFELAQGPIPRTGLELFTVEAEQLRRIGVVTSGTFSPVLGKPLGMGYVETAFAKAGTTLTMVVRSQRYAANVVKLPFWKQEQGAFLSKTAKTVERLPDARPS